MWRPPRSPIGMLQEDLWPNEWKILVACLLHNQTSRKQVDKVYEELFCKYPTACSMKDADVNDLQSLIKPLGIYFDIHPVHLAIIFIANLELGFLTPPVGMNLFLSAYRFKEDMNQIYKATLPFFVVKLIAVVLITYLPFITIGLLQ